MWGITAADYLRVADPWPLNPKGEFLLGVSIEDRHALANAEVTTKVPGLAFADWGPGDMRFSLGLVNVPTGVANPASTTALDQARSRVLAACKAANLAFSEAMTLSNVADQLRAGVRISSAPPEVADKARRLTKREMPW